MTLQNLFDLNVINKHMFYTIVNDKGTVNDMAPYWRIQKKFKSKEIYVLEIDYEHNTMYAYVR